MNFHRAPDPLMKALIAAAAHGPDTVCQNNTLKRTRCLRFRAFPCNCVVAFRLRSDTVTALRCKRQMRIRLIRKLANVLNGVDLTHCRVGNTLDVELSTAQMLVAEEWAEPVEQKRDSAVNRLIPDSRTRKLRTRQADTPL